MATKLRPMHILVHEPDHRGHRFTTVRVLISALLELKQELENSPLPAARIQTITLATTRTGTKTDAYREQLSPVLDQIAIKLIPEIGIQGNAAVRTLRRVQGLRLALKNNNVDHVYLPYADGVLQLMAIARLVPGLTICPAGVTTEGLIMQNSFAYPATTRNRQLRATLGIRHCGCDRVHVNDPVAWNFLQSNKVPGMGHVRLIPDPITDTISHDKQQAREALGLPLDARIAGTVGVINTRKGADVLVKSFTQAPLNASDRLLLAGKFTPEISELVKQANDSRIICLDRYLTEEELSYALSAMDLVVTAYPPVIGSASIVIRAAATTRRVLGSDTGWIGHIVEQFELGDTAPPSNIEKFSSQLAASLDIAPMYEHSASANQFSAFNTSANVRAHWTSLLREKMGLPPHAANVPWKD